MEYLNRRDGRAFKVSPPRTAEGFTDMVQEAVALADATGLYVVIDVGGCRVVVNKNTDPNKVTSEWWDGPRMGRGYHIGIDYNVAYTTNDRLRAARLRAAPAMSIVDEAGWERSRSTNRNYGSRYDLAEHWARLMQLRMGSSRRLTEITAHIALYEADEVGSVQAVQPAVNYRRTVLDALTDHWEYGGQLRKLFR